MMRKRRKKQHIFQIFLMYILSLSGVLVCFQTEWRAVPWLFESHSVYINAHSRNDRKSGGFRAAFERSGSVQTPTRDTARVTIINKLNTCQESASFCSLPLGMQCTYLACRRGAGSELSHQAEAAGGEMKRWTFCSSSAVCWRVNVSHRECYPLRSAFHS